MTELERLRKATTKVDLAKILNLNAPFLTRTLYINKIENQYTQFQIPKRSGGHRTINAPTSELKDIQSRLSKLLLNCIDEINASKNVEPRLSHGFTRKRSIITNAEKHVHQKNVLNIDLSNFFDSFNFGRVRGFFIKNNNFLLHKDIATVIAKIACLNDGLPQGSPCSPVITNLISHSLDIQLASLAKKNSCTYSRYADDITFSTRNREFKPELVKVDGVDIFIGSKLLREVERAGFKINETKTRVQFKDSRQDVTGLVVNKKVSIKSEYWRTTRAMCHQLFISGSYTIKTSTGTREGTINELQGRLNFIDSIDRYNHMRPKGPPDKLHIPIQDRKNYREKLNVREKVFSKFLYYRNFHANEKPTILCEGKTDNIYLKAAIHSLSKQYGLLAKSKTKTTPFELLIKFFNYSKRTRYLLDLHGGGSYLKDFVQHYQENLKYYQKTIPKNPVILLLDNDSGPKELIDLLVHSKKFPDFPNGKDDIKNGEFVHITSNLYLILTPLKGNKDTMIENFFDKKTLSIKVDGRSFDYSKEADSTTKYGKNTFATKVVLENKSSISFKGFKPILSRIEKVIKHYKALSGG
ncbi:retron Ec67 family RNA-directed DNA polymerase/endonuclease [Mariprofundus ferrooxydans]|uniref:retron Ec67 family RNA-directed DNA polymerase/endonuclease n=1 Tax=Mariprofundus ferrooxydans TaxID=314344 RepID=UPI00035DD76C|nr:retron Ec67 family RNA-directed DNA polymerase/endonuclease [Mariprofundus ferrooxydans]